MPATIYLQRALTLIEMLLVLVISTALILLSLPSLLQYIKNTRLQEAKTALMQNALFLERHYLQNRTFRKNHHTWPVLPRTETTAFTIQFTGIAKGVRPNRFRISATPKASWLNEHRFLTIDQDHRILICTHKGNSTPCTLY